MGFHSIGFISLHLRVTVCLCVIIIIIILNNHWFPFFKGFLKIFFFLLSSFPSLFLPHIHAHRHTQQTEILYILFFFLSTSGGLLGVFKSHRANHRIEPISLFFLPLSHGSISHQTMKPFLPWFLTQTHMRLLLLLLPRKSIQSSSSSKI